MDIENFCINNQNRNKQIKNSTQQEFYEEELQLQRQKHQKGLTIIQNGLEDIQYLSQKKVNQKIQVYQIRTDKDIEGKIQKKLFLFQSQEVKNQNQSIFIQSTRIKFTRYSKAIIIFIFVLLLFFIIFQILIPNISSSTTDNQDINQNQNYEKYSQYEQKNNNEEVKQKKDSSQLSQNIRHQANLTNFLKAIQSNNNYLLEINKQEDQWEKNTNLQKQEQKKQIFKDEIAKYQFGFPSQRLEQTFKFWFMTGNNISQSQELQEYVQDEINYFEKKYQISKYGEIQICVLVLSYMNQANGRYKRNLDSIFQQQYTNFKVYYVDDHSEDKTAELVEKYIKDRKLQDKIKLYKNKEKKGKSSNQFYIGQENCKPGSVMVVVDGDDELIGRQVFKFLSAAYQSTNLYYIYTHSVIISQRDKIVRQGYSIPLNPNIIKNTNYRRSALPSHLRTWMSDLFLDIKKEDLLVDDMFPQTGQDVGSSFQLMEKAGTRVGFINQHIYRYVMGTGLKQ